MLRRRLFPHSSQMPWDTFKSEYSGHSDFLVPRRRPHQAHFTSMIIFYFLHKREKPLRDSKEPRRGAFFLRIVQCIDLLFKSRKRVALLSVVVIHRITSLPCFRDCFKSWIVSALMGGDAPSSGHLGGRDCQPRLPGLADARVLAVRTHPGWLGEEETGLNSCKN